MRDGSSGGVYLHFAGGASHAAQRKSAVGPRWTSGASAATLFLFASFESPTRKFVRGLNSNVSLLHAGESHGQALLAFISGLPRNYRLT